MTIEEQLHVIAHLLESAAQLALRNETALLKLAEGQELLTRSVETYVAASNERMKQMEANLDALIRIITAEHSNGKGKL